MAEKLRAAARQALGALSVVIWIITALLAATALSRWFV